MSCDVNNSDCTIKKNTLGDTRDKKFVTIL